MHIKKVYTYTADPIYSWTDEPDVTKPGMKPAAVGVTYADDSRTDVDFRVNVGNDAYKYTAQAIPEEVNLGGEYNLTDNIANLPSLPQETKVVDITPAGTIDTTKARRLYRNSSCRLSRW